jgi:hypothetical protein
VFWLAPLIGAAIAGIAYPYLFGRHEELADRPVRDDALDADDDQVSTERGRPDPVSDLVEVARKQGQFRRVRVVAARPRAPIALVAGGHGVRCWRRLLRSTRAERSARAVRVGWP